MKTLIALVLFTVSLNANAAVVTYKCSVHIQQLNPRAVPPESQHSFDISFDDKEEEDASYGLSESGEAAVEVGHDMTVKTVLYMQNAEHKTGRVLERKLKARVSVAVAGNELRAANSTVDLEQPMVEVQLDENLRAVSDCVRK